MGNNYIGITIANYGLGDDILTFKNEDVKNDEKEDEKDKKKL